MYKIIRADSDTYITDRVINGVRKHSANVGKAGTLDLYKLYGHTTSASNPNIELSRLLIHFNLDSLRDLIAQEKIDISNPSFSCKIKLFDVYGGQPTPEKFTVIVHPLSRSFDEGNGQDVVFYADSDVCNFLTGSRDQGPWILSGCNAGGDSLSTVDYIETLTSPFVDFKGLQYFKKGDENLEVDVTTSVSATLANIIPDNGFRISLDQVHENDNRTYFVKRFASHTAYNEDKHPQLIVKYDDSIQDDSQILYFDSPGSIFLYNYINNTATNIVSASTQIAGSNSLLVELTTAVSGGQYGLIFTGSQHTLGSTTVKGVYSASIVVPSGDSVIFSKISLSGSVKFTPIWKSLDSSVVYLTGSDILIHPSQRFTTTLSNNYIVNVLNVKQVYESTENPILDVNIFDKTSPLVKLVKTPIELPGLVIRDVHYQIRDNVTNEIIIPFDIKNNSTRLSSNLAGMYFKLDMSNLISNRAYNIDIMIYTNGNMQLYTGVSPVFRVS